MSDASALSAARRGIERTMRLIVSRDRPPYRAGWRIWGTSFEYATRSREVMWPMWLLWGALTDWVEMNPAETPQAEAAMRRAAQEWLAVPDEVEAQRAYFERWLYEEMGYQRPQAARPASS